MNREELNTALYEKMFAEQEQYRDWLLGLDPAEILDHTYEYTLREDILLALEYHDLEPDQARAMLQSPNPLGEVFQDFEKLETDHMNDIWDCLEARADRLLQRQWEREREQEERGRKPSVLEKLKTFKEQDSQAKPAAACPSRDPER